MHSLSVSPVTPHFDALQQNVPRDAELTLASIMFIARESRMTNPSVGYEIVTPTYQGPDRRKRRRQVNPHSLLDRAEHRRHSESLWSMYIDARSAEPDER